MRGAPTVLRVLFGAAVTATALFTTRAAPAAHPISLAYGWRAGDAAVVHARLVDRIGAGSALDQELDGTFRLLAEGTGSGLRVHLLEADEGAVRFPEEWRGGVLSVDHAGHAGPAALPPPGFDPGPLSAFAGPSDRAVRRLWETWVEAWAGTTWSLGVPRDDVVRAAAPALGWRDVPTHRHAGLAAVGRCPSPPAGKCATVAVELVPAPDEVRSSLEALRERAPELGGTDAVAGASVREAWTLVTELHTLRPRAIHVDRVVRVELSEGAAERHTSLDWSFTWGAPAATGP